MLNAHCTRRKATLYFTLAIAATLESLVTDIVTDVLIRFPIIAQRSKGGAHCFHRVVGLVVINVRHWVRPIYYSGCVLLAGTPLHATHFRPGDYVDVQSKTSVSEYLCVI